jgi:hypothetical protein
MEHDAEYCRLQAEKCKHLANLISVENVREFLLEKGREWLRMAEIDQPASTKDRASTKGQPHTVAIS